jgi:hypothetical protein
MFIQVIDVQRNQYPPSRARQSSRSIGDDHPGPSGSQVLELTCAQHDAWPPGLAAAAAAAAILIAATADDLLLLLFLLLQMTKYEKQHAD